MGSELAAPEPKWVVATRVVPDRHLIVAARSEETHHGLWRTMPCAAGTSYIKMFVAIFKTSAVSL